MEVETLICKVLGIIRVCAFSLGEARASLISLEVSRSSRCDLSRELNFGGATKENTHLVVSANKKLAILGEEKKNTHTQGRYKDSHCETLLVICVYQCIHF